MELVTKFENPKLKEDQLKQIVRQLGLKITQQRLIILETILRGRPHVSAQEVFEAVTKKAPDIGFATVYRLLRTLSTHGFMTEVRMGGLPARYEWAQKQHHDHISCTRCHRIAEFENDEIELLQKKVAAHLGFELTGHILELYGLCPDCRANLSPTGDLRPLPF